MDVEKEEADAPRAREVTEHVREEREPRCPQFRLHHSDRLYPAQGACVLAGWPGWFMIPSIAEYREYCTTPHFSQCCWFCAAAETPGPSEGRTAGPATDDATWRPPEVRGMLAA